MREVPEKHQSRLDDIKKTVQESYTYFRENYERFSEFRRFVFQSSMTADEINLLASMNRPQLEFNVLEAYISRLLGEFSKQEPDIEVSAYDEMRADPVTISLVSQHLKHVFSDEDNKNLRYEVYKDLLSGGFSAIKIYTDYEHKMSMSQVIRMEKCEPTLCGFDPSAVLPHKGDGRYCFQLFPMSKEQFEKEYPDISVKTLSFRRDFSGFSWSHSASSAKTLLICDFYEKKLKDEHIVQLSDGRVMTTRDYRKLIDEWDDIELPPATVGKPRKTVLESICRYRLVENKVIEYEDTDFEMLPVVFVDGSSIMISHSTGGDVKQVTRPYVYHAKGAQRLKNYAGNSLANEIENTVQHKFMVAKEALPEEDTFLDAYKNVQQASVLVYNSFAKDNPDMPIANPVREIMRVPPPPEIQAAFGGSDSTIQNVLGSYDASLGINNNQLSGVAIVEAASQSNATAMPYIVGCLQGMQRLAQIYVNLMPKYMVTPRTLPFMDDKGRRQFVKINQEGGIDMDFDTNVLNVSLRAGASFQVQKNRTINMVKEIMGMSPEFSAFINSKGLRFVLDNMDGKGIEELKDLVEEWTQEQAEAQQQAAEMERQAIENDAANIRAKAAVEKVQLDAIKQQQDFSIDVAKLELEREKTTLNAELTEQSFELELMKILMDKKSSERTDAIAIVDMDKRHAHNRDMLRHDIMKHVSTLASKNMVKGI